MISIHEFKPQTRTILRHLHEYGHITGKEAWDRYQCRSLSKRVSELRQAGVPITSKLRRDKYGQRYAHYKMVP